MSFLSNFGGKIIFMSSVNFWHQQDSNLLFKRKYWSRDLLVQVAYIGLKCSEITGTVMLFHYSEILLH